MIICNGRCLTHSLTGMQRYTSELLAQLPQIKKVMPPAAMSGRWGHLWEQFILPVTGTGHLIWTPANAGILFLPARQVITLHDLAMIMGPDSHQMARRTRYFKWMLPRLLGRVEGVLTVSEYSRQQIIETFHFPADRILATPLGVDHHRFHPYPQDKIDELCARLGISKHFVLSVSSGSSRKNLGRLLDAWKICQTQVDDSMELVISGDAAAYGKAFDGSEIPPLPPRTKLAGRVSEADLPLLMAGARLFVYPSLFEGFGLPPLEAMACGTACIVSNTTSLPEVVGNSALMVNPLQVEEIAATMAQVLTTPSLQEQLEKNSLAQAAKFTWEETARQTLAFLKSHG